MKEAQIALPTEDGRTYYDMAGPENPCIACSACCQHFRVSFYHGELDTQPEGLVPADLTVQITPFRACMKGTESGNGRCIALQDDGFCGIYSQRPSVCREFPVFMEDGSMNPDCLRLRALYGIDARPSERQVPEGEMIKLDVKIAETNPTPIKVRSPKRKVKGKNPLITLQI